MTTFWLLHADAVGVAILAAGAAAIGWLWLDCRHQRALHAQATQPRGASFDETVTGALAVTARTPLTDSYPMERTVADVPSPYRPAFTVGALPEGGA